MATQKKQPADQPDTKPAPRKRRAPTDTAPKKKRSNAKVTARTIELNERRRKALALRSRRMTYEQIAEALDYYDRAAAWRDIQQALKDQLKEPAEDVRRQELELLDAMVRGLAKRAVNGDDKAIQSVLNIQRRRALYLGLDAPTQVETAGPGGFRVMVDPDLLPDGVAIPVDELADPE